MKTNLHKADFTFRELQVIGLIRQGNSTQEIADCLHLSTFTIKKHRENIARKLGSKGKSEFRKTLLSLFSNTSRHLVLHTLTNFIS